MKKIKESEKGFYGCYWSVEESKCAIIVVDERTAAADACQMEHAVSSESYEALKRLANAKKI